MLFKYTYAQKGVKQSGLYQIGRKFFVSFPKYSLSSHSSKFFLMLIGLETKKYVDALQRKRQHHFSRPGTKNYC